MTLREFLSINLRDESRGVPVCLRIVVISTYLCFIAVVSYFAVDLPPLVAGVLVVIAFTAVTWCAVWLFRSYRRRRPAP